MMNIEQHLNAREARRFAREDRDLGRALRRHDEADKMIGELCRDGATVYYVYPDGGRYREGTRPELIDFLTRNRYV